MIDVVVAPVDQVREPVQLLAVNVTLSPTQIPSLVAVIVGVEPTPPLVITMAFELLLVPQVFLQVAV